MNTKFSYTLVGLFVVVFAIVLVAIAIWLGLRQDGDKALRYLISVNESVAGLNPKASVKYRGVAVGSVDNIALDPNDPSRVNVSISVEPNTPIKTDTVATLKSQGITGVAFIELSGGSPDSARLLPTTEQPVPIISSTPSLLLRIDTAVTSLINELSTVAGNTSEVVSKLNKLLESSNIEATAGILENVREMTESFSVHVSSLSREMSELSRFTSNAADVSEQLPTLAIRMGESVDALKRAASSVDKASRGFDRLTKSSQKSLDQLAGTTLPQVDRLLGQLHQLTGTVNQLAQQLERNPNMLLFGRGGRRGPGE
ncbi:MAG: MlaD family protein [Pseudomonadota bacterium]